MKPLSKSRKLEGFWHFKFDQIHRRQNMPADLTKNLLCKQLTSSTKAYLTVVLLATSALSSTQAAAADCPKEVLGPILNNPAADLPSNTNAKQVEHEKVLIRQALQCPKASTVINLASKVTAGNKSKENLFISTTLTALKSPNTNASEVDRRVAAIYVASMEGLGKLGYARKKMIRDCRALGPVTKPDDNRTYEPSEPLMTLMTKADPAAIKLGFRFLQDEAERTVDSRVVAPGCSTTLKTFLEKAKL
jgi:hypothetical protein